MHDWLWHPTERQGPCHTAQSPRLLQPCALSCQRACHHGHGVSAPQTHRPPHEGLLLLHGLTHVHGHSVGLLRCEQGGHIMEASVHVGEQVIVHALIQLQGHALPQGLCPPTPNRQRARARSAAAPCVLGPPTGQLVPTAAWCTPSLHWGRPDHGHGLAACSRLMSPTGGMGLSVCDRGVYQFQVSAPKGVP